MGNNLAEDKLVTDGRSGTNLIPSDANSVLTQGQADLNESNAMYDGMIADANAAKDEILAGIEANRETQTDLANQQTDFTIQQINQQKDQAKKDYEKEQSAAYVDWQKQSNPYGVNAEQMAANGLTNSGYSESSQVQMYVAYQNRVAVARESYNKAVVDYNNAITEAKLNNSSVLAEIAANALEQSMEATITFLSMGQSLLTQKADAAYKIKQATHSNYMDILNYLENQRQFDETMAYNKSKSGTGSTIMGSTFEDTGNSGYIQDSDGRIVEVDSFTGTTYKEATAYLRMYGMDSSGLMTQSEWQRHKNNPNNNNAHTNYDSYEEYLKDYVSYAMSK
jgi:hypothetical protein